MESKIASVMNVKKAGEGKALVVIATLGVKDKDGDVLLGGAFGDQITPVVGTHNWASVPLGKAHIFEQNTEALADITFNLNTTEGKNWYESVKFDYENPPVRQQYSWGFRVLAGQSHMGDHHGEQVRFLHADEAGNPLQIAEVSPVLLGAGVNTRTLAVKEEHQDTTQESRTDGLIDAKRLSIEQLVTLLDSQIEHLCFVQDLRAERGKKLSDETVTMIDSTSKRFDALRARLHLGAMARGPIDEELQASYQALSTRLSEEAEMRTATDEAETEELYRTFAARDEELQRLLYHP